MPDGGNAEGVAGQTWAQNRVLAVSGLPDLERKSNQKAVKKYAEETWVDEGWVRAALKEKGTLARYYCGIPVEVKGRLWGVLLLDSRDDLAGQEERYSRVYTAIARLLGKLLEKA